MHITYIADRTGRSLPSPFPVLQRNTWWQSASFSSFFCPLLYWILECFWCCLRIEHPFLWFVLVVLPGQSIAAVAWCSGDVRCSTHAIIRQLKGCHNEARGVSSQLLKIWRGFLLLSYALIHISCFYMHLVFLHTFYAFTHTLHFTQKSPTPQGMGVSTNIQKAYGGVLYRYTKRRDSFTATSPHNH